MTISYIAPIYILNLQFVACVVVIERCGQAVRLVLHRRDDADGGGSQRFAVLVTRRVACIKSARR